jgi:hypothetical protein
MPTGSRRGSRVPPRPKQNGTRAHVIFAAPERQHTPETVSMEARSANVFPHFADFCSCVTSNLWPSTALRGAIARAVNRGGYG